MIDPYGFFEFLQLQILEGVIVEDEVELARLAALVPELCAALRLTLPFTDLGSAALKRAELMIEDIVPKERISALP